MPEVKTISFDLSRFKIAEKNLSDRQAALKQYCDKMPDLKPSLIATKMAHLSVDQLNQNFHYMQKQAKNFTAYWKWCFMPKKK